MADRSVAALQCAAIWPKGTFFHKEPVPVYREREAWGQNKRTHLNEADIVFLDPDNGIGDKSPKHATFSELRLLRQAGRAVAFITFPGRNRPHVELVGTLHRRLQVEAGTRQIITLRTNISVPSLRRPSFYFQRQRWITLIDADAELLARTRSFARNLATISRLKVHIDETDQLTE